MITPAFTGQIYRDTATGNIWKANSTTPGDWTLLMQDMKLKWNSPFPMNEAVAIRTNGEMADHNANVYAGPIEALSQYLINGYNISYATGITSISFPNLLSIDPNSITYEDLIISHCDACLSISAPLLAFLSDSLRIFNMAALTSVDFSALVTLGYKLQIMDSPSLTSLSFPNLTTVSDETNFNNDTTLTTISFPNFLPTNTKSIYFKNCALTSASVEHILARCVANPGYVNGGIEIDGGTNAAPLQGAGTNHDILEARGFTIVHN